MQRGGNNVFKPHRMSLVRDQFYKQFKWTEQLKRTKVYIATLFSSYEGFNAIQDVTKNW